jgi:hypothetical protein
LIGRVIALIGLFKQQGKERETAGRSGNLGGAGPGKAEGREKKGRGRGGG